MDEYRSPFLSLSDEFRPEDAQLLVTNNTLLRKVSIEWLTLTLTDVDITVMLTKQQGHVANGDTANGGC